MSNFLKKQKQKIIVALAAIIMGLTGIPMLPVMAVDYTTDTIVPIVETPKVTTNGKRLGKVSPGDVIEFKVTDNMRLAYIFYAKDKFADTSRDGYVDVTDTNVKEYTYRYTVPQGETGLHEIRVAGVDYNSKMSNWTTVTYYVVPSGGNLTEDTAGPALTKYPKHESKVVSNQKITIGYQDETDIYYIGYKWVNEETLRAEGKLDASGNIDSYLTQHPEYYSQNSTIVWKPNLAKDGGISQTQVTPPSTGNWYLFMHARDGANNISEGRYAKLFVKNDITPPIITLTDANKTQYVKISEGYKEVGVTAYDEYDGKNISVSIDSSDVENAIRNAEIRECTVNYTAVDANGNVSTAQYIQ